MEPSQQLLNLYKALSDHNPDCALNPCTCRAEEFRREVYEPYLQMLEDAKKRKKTWKYHE